MGKSKTLCSLLALVVFAACTADENPTTFQNEPLILGSDPNAVVRTIDEPDYPAVLLTHENGVVGVSIFQPETGSPVLTLRDDNNDGVFDLLTYSALSESGESLVDVDDYGMDGQPDFILNYQDKTASVFVDGHWHSVDGVATKDTTVLLNGKRVSLAEVLNTIRQPK
jgi:hypothetical protein